jgi:hypothetical protein
VQSALLDEMEMAEETARFISLATRSLDEAEREAAGHELAARIAHAGGESEVPQAAERLASSKPPPAWRLPVLASLILAGLVTALAYLIPSHWKEARLLAPIHHQGFDRNHPEHLLAALGPAADDVPLRTVYFRDQSAWSSEVDALLAEAPDNPAYYRFYARWFSYLHPKEVLPPDYQLKWEALDRDNALWGIYAANQLAEKSIRTARGGVHTVTDEPRFLLALDYFRDAASRDFCQLGAVTIQDRQLRSFRRENTLESACIEQQLLQLVGSDVLNLYSILKAIEVQADRLVASGDKVRLEQLMKDLRKVVTMIMDDPSNGYFSLHLIGRTASRFAGKCRGLGLTEQAEWLERLKDTYVELRAKASPSTGLARSSSSFAGRWFGGYADANFTLEDMKAGRMAEYAVADRFAAATGVIIFSLMVAGCMVEVLRRRSASGLARGLMPLWRGSDYLWLIGLGVGLPLFWWFGIVHGSPLGCRDIGLTCFQFAQYPLMQPWLSQDMGGLVFGAVMIIQMARWRWAKRGAFLALGQDRMWIGWTMAVVAALFIPIQGIVRYLPAHQEKFLLLGSTAGGIALLWLVWQVAVIVFFSRENSVGVQLLVRAILPAAATMAVLLLATMPLLRKTERAWVAKDELMRRDPAGTGLSVLERRGNDPLRLKLLEALK